MQSLTSPEGSATVLDALRTSPLGPVLDAPLPVPPGSAPALPALPDAVLTNPIPGFHTEPITDLLRALPIPSLPELEVLLQPMRELAAMFGTGIVEGLDPSAWLHRGSRLLEAATALGRSALHALPESWEGATAEEATDHGVRAQRATLELTDRGDRIGEVTRAATATVERGNIELTGIVQSFVAFAIASAPVLPTPPGQAALLAAAVEHLHAALAVVARTRGELVVHTVAMNALSAPISVPAPVAVAGIPEPRALASAASDIVSTAGRSFTVPDTYADTVPSATTAPAAATVPAGASAPLTAPAGSLGGGVPAGSAGAGMGSVGAAVPAATPVAAGSPAAAVTPSPATAGSAGRGSVHGGVAPGGASRSNDDERRAPAGIRAAAGTSTDVVGDLPLVAPAVIGRTDDW